VSGGEEFYIEETGGPYDIEIVTASMDTIYVEVKSTYRAMSNERVSYRFGNRQLKLFACSTAGSVLALVFCARDEHPEILYFSIGPFRK
jgi:hypothetical protein